jgi:hypothetical protein
MARYEQTYSGERRTCALHVQLTPGERTQLESASQRAGAASLSAHVRSLCLRWAAESEVTAPTTRRNPEALRLAFELNAIGNNLNQLARIANMTKAIAALRELRSAIRCLKAAIARVVAL